MGILYTTKSNDGMGENYSQRNWFMFPHSKSHEKTPCPWIIWTSKVVTVMTIDCNLLLPSWSNLKFQVDPPKAAPAAIMQGTSFDQHVNSIKSRPCTKLLTFVQVFNKSACKLNSNTFSLFLPCPSVKNTLGVFFCMCTNCLGPKRKGLHGRKWPKTRRDRATSGWPTAKQWG